MARVYLLMQGASSHGSACAQSCGELHRWPEEFDPPGALKASLINTNQEGFQQNSSSAISFLNGTWTTVIPSLALLIPNPLVPFLLHPRTQQGLLAERSNQSATGCNKCWGKEREISKFYHWSSYRKQFKILWARERTQEGARVCSLVIWALSWERESWVPGLCSIEGSCNLSNSLSTI